MKTNVVRISIMAVLIIVGFVGIMAEPAPQLTGMAWLAAVIISKTVGVAALLGCGTLGRMWYGWNVELNK